MIDGKLKVVYVPNSYLNLKKNRYNFLNLIALNCFNMLNTSQNNILIIYPI